MPDEYRVYRAALEWDLTDPIVIEDQDDFKSTPRWQDRLTPYHHQVSNLITFCRRLPVTLLADDVGLGKYHVQAAILSPNNKHLATCSERRAMLGMRVRQVGALFDLTSNSIVGRICTGKRSRESWSEAEHQ